MKKIFLVLLLTSGSIFANTIKQDEIFENEIGTDLARTKCEIVRDNLHDWCLNHGFDEATATSISNAAFKECKKVSIAEAP